MRTHRCGVAETSSPHRLPGILIQVRAVVPLCLRGSTLSTLTLKAVRVLHVGPIDLSLSVGECVCLSGASGVGKSLLLRAVADLVVHDGEAYLDDAPCQGMNAPQWRRQVGLLPPESAWWFERVGEHFPAGNGENDVLHGAFAQLGFKAGTLDWEVARCSSGERQRLALLRLLAQGPRALLLDEPTASLDPKSVARVEAMVTRYRKEHAAPVLWVSHDPAQIERMATQHLIMGEDGQLERAA